MEGKEVKQMRLVVVVEFLTCFFSLLSSSTGAPIRTPDFSSCVPANYPNSLPGGQSKTVSCCPPLSNSPPVDFKPPQQCIQTSAGRCEVDNAALRVRPAVQCADSSYGQKLRRAYELMRALPDDDPRSLLQQANVHCAYCGGAFLQSGSTTSGDAIDIHYSWLFFPWHRMYLHFHERILQSLLNDTSFSLPFWNWDNNQLPHESSRASCQQIGNVFPRYYNDSSSSLFDENRNPQHSLADAVIDLSYLTTRSNASASPLAPDLQVSSNMNVMHQTMISAGTTAETFLGAVYRAGDPRPRPTFTSPEASGGTLELGPHVSAHFWVGQDFSPYLDFAAPWVSAYDPVFYAHHANVDRLWSAWKGLGRADYDDPDWLNAEFLFYDEAAQLVRVKVSDALDTRSLGYTYESVDNSWEDYNATKCGNVDPQDMAQQLQKIPQPQRPNGERVTLSNGGTFNAVLSRRAAESPTAGSTTQRRVHHLHHHHQQDNNSEDVDSDEMLVIRGIRFDPTGTAQFDVFINLPDANSETALSCAEYVGRFNYLPLPNSRGLAHRRRFMWKIGIARTLRDLQMDTLPSVLVTLVSRSGNTSGSPAALSFRSVAIERRR